MLYALAARSKHHRANRLGVILIRAAPEGA